MAGRKIEDAVADAGNNEAAIWPEHRQVKNDAKATIADPSPKATVLRARRT
jgi:hypothetical protein